jgi:hypothetical protein
MSGRPKVVAGTLVAALLAVAWSVAPAAAAFPGRNGLIAVHAYRGDAIQMWLLRSDGSGLTRFPVYGEGAFSPDGQRIALVRGRSLTVTDLNGQRLQTLETRLNGKRLFISGHAWSPAADRVYVGSDKNYAVSVAGGPPQPLGRGGDVLDVSVTGRIAYETDANSYDGVIYTSDAGGGDVHRVGRGSSPSWSPDGTRLAFLRNNRVFVAGAEGTGAAPLPNVDAGRVLYLAWSPDGTQIALLRWRNLDDEVMRLAILELATGAIREVVSERKLDATLVFGLDWQPLQGDDEIVLPERPALAPCDKLGARTLLQTKRARIFTENDRLYGCLYSTGRIVELTQGGGLEPTLGEVALAGRYIGFEIESNGPDDGPFADLFVQDLRTGRLKRATNSVDPSSGFAYADVRSLVLTRKGAIAWIVRPYSNRGNFKPLPLMQVQKLDRTGVRLLDSGTGITADSLQLTRRRIVWQHGNTERTAILR